MMLLMQAQAGQCQESCQFLKKVNSIRPGTCPSETQATGVAAMCVTGCQNDGDCDAVGFKCCSNSCGWTCRQASHLFEGRNLASVLVCFIFEKRVL